MTVYLNLRCSERMKINTGVNQPMNIFSEAARRVKLNQPFAFTQIIESRGSTPRHSGQMLVTAEGETFGTIGGGMMERLVIEQAIAAIAEQKSRVFHGRMARNGSDAVGSDCGGAMTVYIDVHGMRPKLILLGAGHVNRAIAHLAAPLGFDIHIADTYADSLNPDIFPPGCRLLLAESFTTAVAQLTIDADSFVIIATNHQDKETLETLIERPVRFLGLLASRRKAQTFREQLRLAGCNEAAIQRLRAPIGFDIGAETPAEIAVSVIAEILQVKNQAAGGLMQDQL